MNEFTSLRLKAKEKRDKAIAHVQSEYEANLVNIARLEQDLLGKRSTRHRTISSAIESVIPSEGTFTTLDILTSLEALDGGRVWRKRSIDNHLSRLRERRIIKRIKRATLKERAVYARADLGMPVADRTLAEFIRDVLTHPMTLNEVVVAVGEAGFKSSMTKRAQRGHVARVLREGFRREGERWIRM